MRKYLVPFATCASLLIISNAYANSVELKATQKMTVSFRTAHKNHGGKVILDDLQTITLDNASQVIQAPLVGYDLSGVVIVRVNGHELPPSVNQFDQPRQCSMTTDKTKTTGAIVLEGTDHTLSCKTIGGVYGS